MLKLYSHSLSGNCHKVQLMLSLLGLEYELVPVDLLNGEQKAPAFLVLNSLGQVPVFIDGKLLIRDAQAILVYLARRYGEAWLPIEAEPLARVMQWLSTAANEIQHSFSAARRHYMFNTQVNPEPAQQKAHQLLQILDQHLHERSWLELSRPTIADIACFPYINLAAEGKIYLDNYPNVRAWTTRIKQLPGYVGMPSL
ncbi:glutathione S-transferase family protein [Leptolyngbya sp. FACHB-261]|uniref:glutathione S-transferase family protein n=1 Tax=Leptolyngbya sp. FACHB-261 TaxID=2692806 RepID=UPI0016884F41|nr:glutathione S-transferase [Leptolyngbya sp. FACHB-261]MBD2100426.1 glutathione S-transferase [Leptolyngbya sp. FACHB-261]